MARLISIDWDSAEVRIVVGRTKGKELVVEQASTVALARSGTGSDEGEMGPQLASAVSQLQLGRGDVLVSVGRANIELRRMQLPPAPDEELPDLVRFQAMRQFTTIGDDWPLDFVPLTTGPQGVEVLAAAIAPATVEQIRSACEVCELTPSRLVLRPFAAASLLMADGNLDSRYRLVVDVLATEADLFVFGDSVAFMRTVRLPHSEPGSTAQVTALLGEIRRTIPAAQSQMGGKRIEAVVVFGDEASHQELRTAVANQLSLPVETLNPFARVQCSRDLAENPPTNPGRYAPLLGMLLDEAGATPHTIDFLHPRKRPEVKSQRERYLAYVTAAVAALCLLAVGIKWYLNGKDQQILQLTEEINASKDLVDESKKRQQQLVQLDQFQQGNIPWLHELERLSLHMPGPEDSLLTVFSGAVQNNGEGRVTLEGMARLPQHVAALEENLRDDNHRIIGRSASQDLARSDFPWRFNETLVIKQQDPQDNAGPSRSGPARSPASHNRSEVEPETPAAPDNEPADTPRPPANSLETAAPSHAQSAPPLEDTRPDTRPGDDTNPPDTTLTAASTEGPGDGSEGSQP
jgi:Tfp pilus assembly PilM family ATPase